MHIHSSLSFVQNSIAYTIATKYSAIQNIDISCLLSILYLRNVPYSFWVHIAKRYFSFCLIMWYIIMISNIVYKEIQISIPSSSFVQNNIFLIQRYMLSFVFLKLHLHTLTNICIWINFSILLLNHQNEDVWKKQIVNLYMVKHLSMMQKIFLNIDFFLSNIKFYLPLCNNISIWWLNSCFLYIWGFLFYWCILQPPPWRYFSPRVNHCSGVFNISWYWFYTFYQRKATINQI